MIWSLPVDGSLPEMLFCLRNSAVSVVWNHLKDSLLESLVESSLLTSVLALQQSHCCLLEVVPEHNRSKDILNVSCYNSLKIYRFYLSVFLNFNMRKCFRNLS